MGSTLTTGFRHVALRRRAVGPEAAPQARRGALCPRDFVAALEQAREPAVPGRAVLITMRLV